MDKLLAMAMEAKKWRGISIGKWELRRGKGSTQEGSLEAEVGSQRCGAVEGFLYLLTVGAGTLTFAPGI